MRLTRAIILAAGLGTRMRPLTDSLPKPLIQVAGKPLIQWCTDWLAAGGITQAVVNTSYRAEQLESYLAAPNALRIQCSREDPVPLETGGGILQALPLLGDAPFLAMNSDAIFAPHQPHALRQLCDAWNDVSDDFLMLVVPRGQCIGWEGKGDFILNDHQQIRRPKAGEDAPYVFTGVEIIHPRVFVDCPDGPFSLSLLWKRSLQPDGFHRRIRAVIYAGDWLNVGDMAGLKSAETYFGNCT